MSFRILVGVVGLTLLIVVYQLINRDTAPSTLVQPQIVPAATLHPLTIEAMRQETYPGSPIALEATLSAQPSYTQHLVSYQSDGYKIFALMTLPKAPPPAGGYPAIIFNHGYIPPEEYQTTQRYVAYVDRLAAAGFVVLKPDYRGHGNSEGNPEGAYYSPAYTRDVLNAVSSLKIYPNINPNRLGMWGHSMGGHLTLRSMVVTKDIRAGVIWGGVVASYPDMLTNWRSRRPWQPSTRETNTLRPNRQQLLDQYGSPDQNPGFWQSISPISYVADISGPVQIHHGLADEVVPSQFSQSLYDALTAAAKPVEYYTYESGDHNLSGPAFDPAMDRTVEFFTSHL